MTPDERKELRRRIGGTIIAIQDDAQRSGFPVTEVVPEIVAALLSLACYIAAHNAGMSRQAMEQAMRMATDEMWK